MGRCNGRAMFVESSTGNFEKRANLGEGTYGIENDRNRIPADTNRIKSDSPDAKQTVPDYFAPVSDSKKTIPDTYLTGTGHD